MKIPKDIVELAQKFRDEREVEEKAKTREKRQAEKKEKRVCKQRLKSGLVYAEKIFAWAEDFRNSDEGKELMRKSILTAYQNIFFFDKHIEGTDWVGFLVSPKGLALSYGGRWSVLTRKFIASSSDLAQSVDTKILKAVCEAIDDGEVWECIKKRFEFLNREEDE